MSNWTAGNYSIQLDFLGDSEYEAVIFAHGPNAAKNASDYRREVRRVQKSGVLSLKWSSGCGYMAAFSRVK